MQHNLNVPIGIRRESQIRHHVMHISPAGSQNTLLLLVMKEKKIKSIGVMYLLSAQYKKFPTFFPASLQHPISPCWPVLPLLWDLTRLESRWFGYRQNNSSFYGNSSASPLTMAFRSLLSNRGDFSSLESSQEQSHPCRNHLALCKEPLLPVVSLKEGSSC